MKLSTIGVTTAVIVLASVIPAYAQKNEKGNDKPQPQHAQQARPAEQPKQAPSSRPAQQAQQPRQPSSQPTHPQQAKAPVQQQSKPSPVRDSEKHAAPAAQQAVRTPQAQHAPAVATRTPQAQHAPAVAARAQAPQVQRSARQVQSWQQQRGWVKQGGGWQPHTTFQQGRDQNWAWDHRDWAQRGGYGGFYIPQGSFGLYFGDAHFFHIGPMPVMYMGYPRFAYGGYSFMVLDPWPGSWQANWYASDDVYIDYSDGYYLHDRRYPGVSLAVSVVL